MEAKFLHTLADENLELQRQMGCMSGILQMFDRQRLLTARRHNGHKQKQKRVASGNALTNCNSVGAEKNASSPRIVLERSSSKSLHENQRTSMDLSMTSFSSSSCSSFSSLDCNKSTQEEHPSIDSMFYTEKSTKNAPRLRNHVADTKTVCSEPQADLSKALQDVEKDSICKDTHAPSVRTSVKEEMKNHVLEHKDSPRRIQLSKSVDGLHITGTDGRARMQVDLAESLRVLVKLKEAPRHFSEFNEPPRKPFEAKDTSLHSASKESPRFSYDGRGSRPSLDPQERGNVTSKLRELPRLSLDSRVGALRSSKSGCKTETTSKIFDSGSIKGRADMTLLRPEEPESCRRLPSVVVKLMGLEAMPNLCQEQTVLGDTTMDEKFNAFDPQKNVNRSIRRSTAANQDCKGDQLSCSQKSSTKDHPTPRRKKSGSVIKPISHSRVPIEPAPWRHHDKNRIPQKMKLGSRESYMKQQSESVYSEIEKNLKQLEFKQTNKDLRALKHILDSMHAKGWLETKKGEEQPSETLIQSTLPRSSQKLGSFDDQDTSVSRPMLMKGDRSPKAFESPIVIMKPAKYVNRSDVSPCSVVPLEGLSDLRRLRLDKKKAAISIQMQKEQAPNAGNDRVPSCQPLLSSEKKCRKEENGMHKNLARMSQVSPRAQVAPRVDDRSSIQASNSVSPRLQQKKIEPERRSCSSLPSSQSNKPPKQPANRHSSESMSPRSRLRQKPAEAQPNYDRLSEAGSRTRSSKHQVDGCISLVSQEESKVRNYDCSTDLCILRQGSGSPSGRTSRSASSAMNQKSQTSKEDISAMDLAIAANEQPSPVSVLDASLYQDDSPSVRVSSNAFKDDETQAPVDFCTQLRMPDASVLKLSSGFHRKKFVSIDHLIDRLRQLSSDNDKAPATDDYIAMLCETQSQDHQYVLEILLASGLLMRDLKSNEMATMPIQLHPSGYPINPDLFLVLEQTKSCCLAKPEKIHRKLVFDVVNELLLQKLKLASLRSHPNLSLQVRKATIPIGRCLLKELCSDIEHLKAENLDAGDCIGDYSLMPGEDMLQQSKGWIDSCKELQPIGLQIERLIFKDLIDEIVN